MNKRFIASPKDFKHHGHRSITNAMAKLKDMGHEPELHILLKKTEEQLNNPRVRNTIKLTPLRKLKGKSKKKEIKKIVPELVRLSIDDNLEKLEELVNENPQVQAIVNSVGTGTRVKEVWIFEMELVKDLSICINSSIIYGGQLRTKVALIETYLKERDDKEKIIFLDNVEIPDTEPGEKVTYIVM